MYIPVKDALCHFCNTRYLFGCEFATSSFCTYTQFTISIWAEWQLDISANLSQMRLDKDSRAPKYADLI